MALAASRRISCAETICSADRPSQCRFLVRLISFSILPIVTLLLIKLYINGQSPSARPVRNSRCKSTLCQLRTNPCATTGTYENTTSSSYRYVNSLFSIQYADNTQAVGDYALETFQIGSMSTSYGNIDSRCKSIKYAIRSRNRCNLD